MRSLACDCLARGGEQTEEEEEDGEDDGGSGAEAEKDRR